MCPASIWPKRTSHNVGLQMPDAGTNTKNPLDVNTSGCNVPPNKLKLVALIAENAYKFGGADNAMAVVLLLTHADDNLEIQLSADRLRVALGVSLRTAKMIFGQLVELGVISRRAPMRGRTIITGINPSMIIAQAEVILDSLPRRHPGRFERIKATLNGANAAPYSASSAPFDSAPTAPYPPNGAHTAPSNSENTAPNAIKNQSLEKESLYRLNTTTKGVPRGEGGLGGEGNSDSASGAPLDTPSEAPPRATDDPFALRTHPPAIQWKGDQLVLLNGSRQGYIDALKGLDIEIDEVLEQAAVSFLHDANGRPRPEGEILRTRWAKYFTNTKIEARRKVRRRKTQRAQRETGAVDHSKIVPTGNWYKKDPEHGIT